MPRRRQEPPVKDRPPPTEVDHAVCYIRERNLNCSTEWHPAYLGVTFRTVAVRSLVNVGFTWPAAEEAVRRIRDGDTRA